MYQTDYITRIADDLNNLGINKGDTILVHSSFKALGNIDGGIETIIRGLLQSVSKEGTLLIPALSWKLRPPEIFNPATTPTNVGAIPEYFRSRAKTIRSIHPTHSVCAVGKLADELLRDATQDHTPCGSHSPFNKITHMENAKIIMLGCGVHPNTTIHAIEELANVPYHNGEKVLFTIINHAGESYQQEYRMYGFTGKYIQRYDRVLELPESPAFTTQGKVLQADTTIFKAKELKDAVLTKLKQNPLFFVDKSDLLI
jgi:aminoglycoside 3-N-acetyltransferase